MTVKSVSLHWLLFVLATSVLIWACTDIAEPPELTDPTSPDERRTPLTEEELEKLSAGLREAYLAMIATGEPIDLTEVCVQYLRDEHLAVDPVTGRRSPLEVSELIIGFSTLPAGAGDSEIAPGLETVYLDPEHEYAVVQIERDLTTVQTDAIEAVAREATVENIEPNCRYAAPGPPTAQSVMGCNVGSQACPVAKPPNDDAYLAGALWGLEEIGAPSVWAAGVTGSREDILVAIVDSGVNYSHKDLEANMWINEDPNAHDKRGNVFSGSKPCDPTAPFPTENCDPRDLGGHGTFVASVLAATGNNARDSVGVGWKIRLIPIRMTDGVGYSTANYIGAIYYAEQVGADIVNLSLTIGKNPSEEYKDAIDEASDVLFVAAAGNFITTDYPAAFPSPNIISVTVTAQEPCGEGPTLNGALPSDPAKVDLAAPGHNICGFGPYCIHGGTCSRSGSSFAAPFVSGASALAWSREAYRNLTPEELKNLLVTESQQIPSAPPGKVQRALDIRFLATASPDRPE